MNSAKKTKMVVVAASLLLLSETAGFAQSQLQTPDGRQTVAPSDMPQQPSLNEEFSDPSKINQKTTPSTGIDMPGLPTFNDPNAGQKPRNQHTILNDEAPGGSPDVGAITYPNGVPSTVRIGPMEEVPMWQRVLLGAFLLLQLAVMVIAAVVLQAKKIRDDNRFNDGHIIQRDYKEPLVHGGIRGRSSGL